MSERNPAGDSSTFPATPVFAPGASESLLTGARLLRRAFLEGPYLLAERDAHLVAAGDPEPPALLIHRGVAFRSFTIPDGRRAIVDILLPGDIIGVDQAVMGRSNQEITAACALAYRSLGAAALRDLIADPAVAMRLLALMGEARWRADRHITAITRFDARGRIGAFILGIHDRLRRRELISRPTFNLPLTQEQMADHLGLTMVHVSRTLRRMREERLLLVDRQVVIILDLDRLREIVSGLPPLSALQPAVFAEEASG